jgi:histidinol-phosphate aminotransferase
MDSITVNNGSDALIHQIMRTMLLPGDVALSTRGTFVSFGIAVATAHREAQYVDLGGGFRYNVEALAAAVTPSTKLIYIANPNNPTGTFITAHELSWLLERIPDTVLVVLDEAYHEYATAMAGAEYPDGVSLRHPNVLALRTFSKAHGLAALRIGYAVGSPDVIRWLLKTKLPFDPNGIGCAAAIAALDDVDHVRRTVETAVEGMAIVSKALNAAGYATSNSVANFVFVDCATHAHAREFHLALLHKGFISRPLAAFGIPTGVRITLGTPAQNAALAIALTELTELILQT